MILPQLETYKTINMVSLLPWVVIIMPLCIYIALLKTRFVFIKTQTMSNVIYIHINCRIAKLPISM